MRRRLAMTYDALRCRSALLLIALPLLVGACDILLGLETPRATVDAYPLDAPSTIDAASADAVSVAPDAASEVDAPVSPPDAEPPPPDAAPDACVSELVCSNGGVYDTCTGEVLPCRHGCCNRGEGIVHCLGPGEVCNN